MMCLVVCCRRIFGFRRKSSIRLLHREQNIRHFRSKLYVECANKARAVVRAIERARQQ